MKPAFDKSGIHYMGRSEKYRYGLAKEKALVRVMQDLNWDAEDHTLAEELLGTNFPRPGSVPHSDRVLIGPRYARCVWPAQVHVHQDA